jgi:RNA polymerase sigma-70 factor (ECF subfamily)
MRISYRLYAAAKISGLVATLLDQYSTSNGILYAMRKALAWADLIFDERVIRDCHASGARCVENYVWRRVPSSLLSAVTSFDFLQEGTLSLSCGYLESRSASRQRVLRDSTLEDDGMEEELIKRIKQGDAAAFQELVVSYATLVGRVARALIPDRAPAEDAVQEAWVDVWRGLSTFEARRPFRPWLLTLVANRCRKSLRRREPESTHLAAADADILTRVSDDLTEEIIRRETHAELRRVLNTLAHDQREVLALRYFAELDLAEISLVIGIPVGTVKSRIHRALTALRVRLERERSAVLGGGSR